MQLVKKLKLPYLIFAYTAFVLVILLCICTLYLKNMALEQELKKWQEENTNLKNELIKINRFSELYNTSPQFVGMVLRESEKNGLDPVVMLELIKIESDFRPNAVSRDGARGLCQLKPVTARELAVELGLAYAPEHLDEPEYNIRLGAYYLAKLFKMNGNDFHKALTAYNRGPSGLENYIQSNGTAVSSYSQRISRNVLKLAM